MTALPRQRKLLHTSPRNLRAFFEVIWDFVARIPRGRVATYGQLAALAGRPRGVTVRHYRAAGARWVGRALAASPPNLPWWRVINSQGKISQRTKGDSHHRQRALLAAEGIKFDSRGRVDLHQYKWRPSPRR